MSKGRVVGMTETASRGYKAMYLAHMNSLTASPCHIKGRGFKSHLGFGFFRVYVSPRIYIAYHVAVSIILLLLLYCKEEHSIKKKNSLHISNMEK